MLSISDQLHGFEVLKKEDLAEIDGCAYEMRHAKSGAKLLYLQNDDENKSFSIAFRTPPADDTGVFHILEHSVLCGSDKFPVKEPFVDLLKSSMQTFLNAMTFPDKTMYPVASTNEQDLLNLIDVYMDAVLNPALYREREIFEQEGHHFEIEEGDNGEQKLVYNGVVFNEMKGVMSDPENVLFHSMNHALFPNSCYAFESGGHPRAIPQLTYEGYCDTHARHYRLDNSYIVLYGDLDINRVLGFLDSNYLGKEQRPAPGAPNPIGSLDGTVANDMVVEMDTTPENACVGLGYVVCDAGDCERVMAVDILADALMGGNESPLKRAVLDSGLGGNCTAYLMDSQARPALMFLLKNARPEAAQEFRELIEREVAKLVEDGIPRDILEASLAQAAFTLRERDQGTADGVILSMKALAGWLYSDDDATAYLRYEQPLASLREKLEGRYYEELLASIVLETGQSALVDVVPTPPALDEEAQELAHAAEQMGASGFGTVAERVAALRVRQETPDAPEDVAKLPRLHVSDIGEAKPEPAFALRDDTPLACLHHTVHARHINYVYAFFDLGHLDFDDMPYVPLLTTLLGNLDTAQRSAADLDTYTRSHLGDLSFFSEVHVRNEDRNDVRVKVACFASALAEEAECLASLPREVWATTRFDDAERIRKLLVQRRIAMEESFVQSGHVCAMQRAHSYLFATGVVSEKQNGIEGYRFLCDLLEHYDERFDELCAKLTELRDRIFVRQSKVESPDLASPLVSFTGTDEELAAFWEHAGDWGLPLLDSDAAPAGEVPEGAVRAGANLVIPAPQVLNEAFVVPNEVSYTTRMGDVARFDAYDGRWAVLQRVLSYDYLWNEVRVKGGAYGCGFRSTAQGRAGFYSYRDPQIDATLERFDAAGKWLADFDPDDDAMEGYIVSVVASHDAPTKPRKLAHRQAEAFMVCKPKDYRDKRRAEYLACTPEALRDLAPVLDAIAESDAFCTFGNGAVIRAARAPYSEIVELLGKPE